MTVHNVYYKIYSMDVKVYQKEEVKQPEGIIEVFKPSIIDMITIETVTREGTTIVNFEVLEDGSKELLEQQCALATIFQRCLDPLDLEDGIQWSETLLGEVTPIQLIDQIQSAVAAVTTSVIVEFDTVKDINGNELLVYKLRSIA